MQRTPRAFFLFERHGQCFWAVSCIANRKIEDTSIFISCCYYGRKQQQIASLYAHNPNVTVIVEGQMYEIPCTSSSSISLLVNLPPEFPNVAPVITVSPTGLRHAWIESDVVTHDPLTATWAAGQTSLGKMVQDIREEFELRPPTKRSDQERYVDRKEGDASRCWWFLSQVMVIGHLHLYQFLLLIWHFPWFSRRPNMPRYWTKGEFHGRLGWTMSCWPFPSLVRQSWRNCSTTMSHLNSFSILWNAYRAWRRYKRNFGTVTKTWHVS